MKLSIVTTTYNSERELPLLYNSLLDQAKYIHEWIICDDGSTDGTWELIKKYSLEAPFPTEGLMQTKKGFRFARSLNNGLRKAMGDFVFIVTADSYVDSRALEEIHLTANKGSLGSCMRVNLNSDGSFHSWDWRNPDGNSDIINISKNQYFYSELAGNGMIIDQSVFKKIGYFDESYEGYGKEDWDFTLRAHKAKIPLYKYNNIRIFQPFAEPQKDNPENITRFFTKLDASR